MLKSIKAGVAFQKTLQSASETVALVCQQIAAAIVSWPRLEDALSAALYGGNDISCSATRIWIKFARKPAYTPESDAVVGLVRRWPAWLQSTLRSIGHFHQRLAASGKLDARKRDSLSFETLATPVLDEGPFFGLSTDFLAQTEKAAKKKSRAERFAGSIRQVLQQTSGARAVEAGSIPPSPETVTWCRACVALAETIFRNSVDVGSVFSDVCLDSNGKSAERKQLQQALLQRNIKVVRWSCNGEEPAFPLIFPAAWKAGSSQSEGACLLVEVMQ